MVVTPPWLQRLACLLVAIAAFALPAAAHAADGRLASDWDSDHVPAPVMPGSTCTSDRFAGVQLATGDLDGDGLEDAVTGCAIATAGGHVDAGSAVVWIRSASTGGFRPGLSVPLALPEPDARCGTTVGIAAHATGSQLVVGCPGATVGGHPKAGVVQVFDVTVSSVTHVDDLVSSAPATDLGCGHSLDVANIDADAQDDLAVGCWHDAQVAPVVPRARGAALVFTRHAGDVGFDRERLSPTTIQEPQAGCAMSIDAVELAGGGAGPHADVLLGCPWDSFTDGSAVFHWEVGTVVAFRRDAFNTGFDPEVRIAETATTNGGSNCGWSLAPFDVTATDYGIATGCRHATVGGSWGAGAVVGFTRDTIGGAWIDHPRLEVGTADIVDGGCGFSLASADLDGDGRDDLVVGCPSAQNGSGSWGKGVVALFRGAAGPAPFVEAPAVTPALRPFPMVCGASLAVADANRDGRLDLLTGCAGGTVGAYANGFALPVLGAASGSGFDAPVLELVGPSVNADTRCGADVELLAGTPGRPDVLVASCNDGILTTSSVTRHLTPTAPTRTFARTEPGTSSEPATVTLVNSGTGIVHTTTPAISGDVDAFSIVSSACTNVTLAPGETCVIGVTFVPTTVGTRRARLLLGTTDGAGPIFVDLDGRTPDVEVATPPPGVDPGAPDGGGPAATTRVTVLPAPRVPERAGRMRVAGSLWLSRAQARRLGLRLPRIGAVFAGSVRRSQAPRRGGSLVDVRVTERVRAALIHQDRRGIPATLRLRVTSGSGAVTEVRRAVRLKR